MASEAILWPTEWIDESQPRPPFPGASRQNWEAVLTRTSTAVEAIKYSFSPRLSELTMGSVVFVSLRDQTAPNRRTTRFTAWGWVVVRKRLASRPAECAA